jgi:hypothetical protein
MLVDTLRRSLVVGNAVVEVNLLEVAGSALDALCRSSDEAVTAPAAAAEGNVHWL